MSRYENAKAMHQYYRDALSQDFTFTNIGSLPKDWIDTLVQHGTCDTLLVAEKLFLLDSGLPDDQDLALKEAILLITQSNLALDRNQEGLQKTLPHHYIKQIKDGINRILKLDPDVNYLIICIELLYRIGEIDDAMGLIEKCPAVVDQSPCLQRIVAMVNVIEENYEEALPYLLKLLDAGQEMPLVQLMGMTCLFQLGGTPDEPVEFSTLRTLDFDSVNRAGSGSLEWLLKPKCRSRTKPTVLIACDDRYFFEHALALLYSIHHTNSGDLFVHLHCYDPDPGISREIENLAGSFPELDISATFETVRTKRQGINVAYASRRFIAADYLLDWFSSPIIVMDADALWRKNWNESVGSAMLDCDAMFCQAKGLPFWEKVPAGLIYLNATDAARRFLHAVACFIELNLERSKNVWYLDQIALSACFEKYLRDSNRVVYLAAQKFIDINHREDSTAWFVTTNKRGTKGYSDYKSELVRLYQQRPEDSDSQSHAPSQGGCNQQKRIKPAN